MNPPPSITTASSRVPTTTTFTIQCGRASRPRSTSVPKATSVTPKIHSSSNSASNAAAAVTTRTTSAGERSIITPSVSLMSPACSWRAPDALR